MPYKNKEDKRRWMEQWYINHLEYKKAYNKQWHLDNPYIKKEIIYSTKKRNCYLRQRSKTDLKYNLNRRMTSAIGRALKGNKSGRKWENLIGYTLNELIKRLQQTMPKGYDWQDYLQGKLHIDHIIPKSIFNYTKPEHPDFKRCWELNNLQLLPAKENVTKDNKIGKPFQPALQLC